MEHIVQRDGYTLLIGDNPSSLFTYFGVTEMHGLNLADCESYPSTKDNAYIAGLCNFIPHTNERFVYLNTSRWSYGLVFHEIMHQSLYKHEYNLELEEEIITWAENESNYIYDTFNN